MVFDLVSRCVIDDFNRDFYLGHPPSSISNYFISFRPQIQTTFDKDSMEIILLQIILELIFRNHVGLGGVPRGNTTINRKILLKTALIMILLLTLTLKESDQSLIWLRVKMSENDLALVKKCQKNFKLKCWFRWVFEIFRILNFFKYFEILASWEIFDIFEPIFWHFWVNFGYFWS